MAPEQRPWNFSDTRRTLGGGFGTPLAGYFPVIESTRDTIKLKLKPIL